MLALSAMTNGQAFQRRAVQQWITMLGIQCPHQLVSCVTVIMVLPSLVQKLLLTGQSACFEVLSHFGAAVPESGIHEP